MKVKGLLKGAVFAALVAVSGASFADNHGMMERPNAVSGMQGNEMQGPMTGQAAMMRGMMMGGDQSGMGGMGAMGGMMSGCSMMGPAAAVLSPQQQLQMHAEMMQAMGKIMEKYAAQADNAN